MSKKVVAPVLITVLMIAWFIGWTVGCFFYLPVPLGFKILGGIVPLALIGVSLYVLIQRIKELRSGEEDDLSKY
jgi:hypothetical protein